MITVRAGYPGDGMKLTQLAQAIADEALAYQTLQSWRRHLDGLRAGTAQHQNAAVHCAELLKTYRSCRDLVATLSRRGPRL